MSTAASTSSNPPKKIIVVGGGSSGWIAASLLHHAWHDRGTRVTLIESGEIPTIGVGEGSTPYLKELFQRLGFAEDEWMPACDATYKCGIRFPGWSTQPGYESYFHPFFSKLDLQPAEGFFHNCGLRRRGYDAAAHPDRFFVAAQLAQQCKSPIAKVKLPFNPDYGYHFDAGLLGQFLKTKALANGVAHIIDTVAEVKQDEHGNITSVLTASHGQLAADFFVDCSGFAGLLINKTLGERFISYRDTLFNDRAVAIPSSAEPTAALPSCTVSTALSNGWVWRIPLRSRFGNGYVYSSDFISPDQAETELRQHLGLLDAPVTARHLHMRVGRVEQHWRNNCLAAGLSQGFIEPLEATALLIQITVAAFIDYYRAGEFSPAHRNKFNTFINMMFDGVRNYIVMHYKLNSRTDSDYWRANRDNQSLPDSVSRLLHAWDKGLDFEQALSQEAKHNVYLRPSWYCILAGYGRFAQNLQAANSVRTASADKAESWCQQTANIFHDHAEYLRNQ
jgi:2-polyprenyl-6-methoxyphenol hydroxylase-like FAD-dependent oxidoreductase